MTERSDPRQMALSLQGTCVAFAAERSMSASKPLRPVATLIRDLMDRSSEIQRRQADAIRVHLGPLINILLPEPETTEVILNPPIADEPEGRIWVTRLGHDREPVGFISAEQAILSIGAVASTMGRAVTSAEPRIEGHLITDRSRFLGGIPPVSKGRK